MAKFGGFGGGMGNMQQLMKQAQKMQEDMMVAKEQLAETEVTGSAGGGMVEITMTCDKKICAVSIKPEACDPDDVEMLEDMLVAALNEAMRQIEEESERELNSVTGGLNIPGL